MRRGPRGIVGMERRQARNEQFQAVGSVVQADNQEKLKNQLAEFKTNLEKFAAKHKDSIKKDPQFRSQFNQMCSKIGVDPLASSKGFWADLLGVGDFYYELGVQIMDVCLRTRSQNGGLISADDLSRHLAQRRTEDKRQVAWDDIERAIKKMAWLGSQFEIVKAGKTTMVRSVPCEFNADQTALLEYAEKNKGRVTLIEATTNLKWTDVRAKAALDQLMQESLVWVDDMDKGGRMFYFPSLSGL